ncbi:DoxX family protein [Micromonospora arborensis]|uniref:DoxX family protein n=1 Tax=Micromonospora arborensis TaxID=2116518 RepID=UPI0033E69A78
MSIVYVVAAIITAAVLAFSARSILVRDPDVVATLTRVGVPPTLIPALALPKIAGALGLLAGIAYRPLGLAAGIGVVLFFIGAVLAHLRIKDAKGAIGPAALALIGTAAPYLAIATA